jgi:hypothetical protein
MSPVRLLGFRTLTCGCVIGCYEELATSRELRYVEEKGVQCEVAGHRRNHTVLTESRTSPADRSFTRAS